MLGVGRWTQMLSAGCEVKLWDASVLNDILKILSFAHDFGKATLYFQKYIENPYKQKSGPLARHSLLSAVVGYRLAKHYFEGYQDAQRLGLFVYVAIKRHHGNLHSIEDEFLTFSEQDRDLLLKQARSIDFSMLEETWEPLAIQLPPGLSEILPFTCEKLENWIKDMEGELDQISLWWLLNEDKNQSFLRDKNEPQVEYSLDNYFKFLYIYSLLLDADKSQVGIREYHRNSVGISVNLVDEYKRHKQKQWDSIGLNDFRNMAYEEISDNLSLADHGNLFKITLPTGMGKTLAAYNFAFRLRDKRLKDRGIPPRIIYALPFLSVIDQNYDVLFDIMKLQGFTGHNILLKHHHLADPVYTMGRDEDEITYSPNASKLLIEGWASEVVVTTFVQLFETLIGWRNSCLRRFHNLAHSIIVLDEIQALPVSYWQLAQHVLEYMINNMNVDIILVTATQPKIFTGDMNPFELVNAERYFGNMDRIAMKVNLFPRTVSEFADSIKDELQEREGKSFLFIFNTIASAKEFYKLLVEMVDEPVAFLSTGVVMKDRSLRIKDIKDKKYRFAVSTQLVEAGVDIDFDVVYRDFAPMDSINQAAGRCNRNGQGERRGVVNIIYLVRENKKRSYAGLIYNNTSLDITKRILKGKGMISESELLGLIDLYFQQAKDMSRASESFHLLEALQNLRFNSGDNPDAGVNDFRLIKQRGNRVNIFVELDREAEEVWLEYEDIVQHCKDFYQRQGRFETIKKDFYQYVISVTVNEGMFLPPDINNFCYVSKFQLKSYYDKNLGFDTSNYENIF
ncbi:CRISPR-associated helicase Cas3' [Desulfoscipio sp. XC116]|uniref:CRISPR-associated helicase Cas3' n=1 Tax=Desulfoscipio sp. XC116 TaxID=3144975 RepID=UPI00325C2CFC